MIQVTELKTIADFEALKKGDYVACEFHRDVYPKKIRFGVFKIALNRADTKEIILDKKDNVYFNYHMFVRGESNLKSAQIIRHDTGN